MRLLCVCALVAGCGDNIKPAAPTDAGSVRVTTGRHLVPRPSVIGGLTASGDVVFFDFDAMGHTVAKAIPLAGGDEVLIAASSGTGKTDLRFDIHGDVVFVWADRGNRVGNLTIWSRAAGVVPIGPNVRPGRAAATADGAYVLYERDVATTTVNIASGPIGGPHVIVGTANSGDNTCWQDIDLAAIGERFLVRACPQTATAFTLKSFATDGTSVDLSTSAMAASYGEERVAWLDGTGAVASALPDGSAAATLATGAAEFAVSDDETTVAYRGTDGSIATTGVDGTGSPHVVVTSGAMALGSIAPDDQTVLYATMLVDMGSGFVQPYMDVKSSSGTVLVPGATSCPGCLASPFTADSKRALLLDPIDNSQAADVEGPIHVIDLATGASVTSFGSTIFDALTIGTTPQFVFLDAVRDSTLLTGWRYSITTRSADADNTAITIATGVEDLTFDRARTTAVYSLAASDADDLAGVWVAPL